VDLLVRLVAVVGGKHSGKTTVIEHLIVEFKRRGYRMGAVKEMVRIPTLDTPATETDRYAQAGAETIVAVPREETVVFVKRRLALHEILPYLGGLDFVLLEGFESEAALPKIVVAKTAAEAESYLDNCAIALSGLIAESETETQAAASLKIPVLHSTTQAKALTDLVEQKALAL
jgi:molybdopterin-guanine dinucleotide biosynthesis adapter protein